MGQQVAHHAFRVFGHAVIAPANQIQHNVRVPRRIFHRHCVIWFGKADNQVDMNGNRRPIRKKRIPYRHISRLKITSGLFKSPPKHFNVFRHLRTLRRIFKDIFARFQCVEEPFISVFFHSFRIEICTHKLIVDGHSLFSFIGRSPECRHCASAFFLYT